VRPGRARGAGALLLGVLPAVCASAQVPLPPREAHALLERHLLENIVPFWYPGAVDRENGGYRLNHDAQGRWRGEADKALVTQARTLWFFSRLHRSPYGQPEHLEAARHGFRFLKDRMWDAEHGGFFWSVSSDGGEAVESYKAQYGQGFGLYALAEYARASGDREAGALAAELFRLLESRAHDPVHGGYLEVLARDWSPPDGDLPGFARGRAGIKTMNTHLHLMEPFTVYYELTGHELVRQRLHELLLIQSSAVVRKRLGACTDRHQLDWTPLTGPEDDRVSYGHDVENVWLLIEAAGALEVPARPLEDLLVALFEYSMEHGWDEDEGGFYDSGPFGEPADRKAKVWWVQAEGMTSALFMFRLTGERRYYDVFARTLGWITRRQADWEHGDWHDVVGERPPAHKSGPWKSPYHNGRAVLECLEILSALR